MRRIFLHVSVADTQDEQMGSDETAAELADRVADQLNDLCRAAKISARILPLQVYMSEDDETGVNLGND